MKTVSGIFALAATANAAYQGFNYGSTFTDGSIKAQSDFEAEFSAAANLDGTDGAFTSARLYTMIQGGTASDPIAAIPAAIKTGTSLLLGLWCSAGSEIVANEITALKAAIEQYGDDFTSLVAGISVGSEDLYRITETAASNGETNPGAQPDEIADYISQVRDAISGTTLEGAKIGHVDTWTVWANTSNQAVFDACDWVGVDAYPYFEKEHANSIDNAAQLFADAIANTNAGTGGKEIWVTETGWPVSGKAIGDAETGLENAKTYWDEVGCPMFGVTNVWWYTYQDANPTTPNPSFGVVGSDVSTEPLYDLSCKNVTSTSSTTASKPSGTGSAGSGSGSSSGGYNGETDTPTPTSSADNGGNNSEDGGNNNNNNGSNDSAAATTTGGSSSPTSGSGSGDDTDTTGGSDNSGSGSGSGSDSGSSSSGGDASSSGGDSEDTTGDSTSSADGSDSTNPTYVDTNTAAGLGRSFGAGVLAIMAAVLAL